MIKEQIRDRIFKELIDENVIDLFQRNMMPINELMSYYRCAIMEVETKFKVLNEQFSLQYDRNPIETIKTRLKSPEGIVKKIKRKDLPFSLQSIEENINDIAGIRVICSFPEDIYLLAECLLKQDDITLIEVKDYIKNEMKKDFNISVDKKKIILPESIKTAGVTKVDIKLNEGVIAKLSVKVNTI